MRRVGREAVPPQPPVTIVLAIVRDGPPTAPFSSSPPADTAVFCAIVTLLKLSAPDDATPPPWDDLPAWGWPVPADLRVDEASPPVAATPPPFVSRIVPGEFPDTVDDTSPSVPR